MFLVLLLGALLALANATTHVEIESHWNGGFKGKFCLDSSQDLNGWTAHLKFDQPLNNLEVWTANAQKVGDGHEWIMTNKDFDAQLHPGQELCVDFVGRGNGDRSPTSSVTIDGQGGGSSSGGSSSGGNNPGSGSQGGGKPLPTAGSSTGGGTAAFNYGKALELSILFYDAQRSGKLPGNNPISWRGDSALGDRGDGGEDLTGGWYDAGDHVKFNLPMSSSTTVLLWGLIRWKDGYEAANQLDMMYDMIKWPLDYFLKCWIPSKQEYYVQVGDGGADHGFWGRPEDMHMNRPAFKVTAGRGGSDVAGETAAAMAAGSIAFKEKDAGYSGRLLEAAKSLYEFAKNHRGIYSQSVPQAQAFYGSTGYNDELCEAAAWLYKATKDSKYLADAKGFHSGDTGWALSWDDKTVSCQLLLYEITQEGSYKTEVENFVKGYMPGGGIQYTPCGLAWRDKWGSLRYAGNAAFVALMAAEDGIQSEAYRKWALSQINYILGNNRNCISYEIGFGGNYPRSPHHRGASCPNRPAPCGQGNLSAGGPSPQLLKGALVGGPDNNDNYRDSRQDYVQNEVACDYNSGFHSAVAGLSHLVKTNELPQADPPKCRC